MRKILFRGKVKGSDKNPDGLWVYGFPYQENDEWFILYDFAGGFGNGRMKINEVDPKTVGQFTGLTDKNGKEIFEGDILKFHATTCIFIPKGYCQKPYEKGQIFIVKSLKSGYSLSIPEIIKSTIPNLVGHVDNYTFWNHQDSFEVIGNIHDNPELLKQ